ncbi:MAG: hypothetical protein H7Y03_11580 [Chitinophagaceae bacterium]|nr:hypothetical protein [Chitinophagaceae bacterium]
MFNPYRKITNEIWRQCLDDKIPYLVTQTFRRGFPTYRKSNPTCVLVTPYRSFATAWEHCQKQSHDPLAALIHLGKPHHLKAMERLLNSGSDYISFWGVIPFEKELFHRCIQQWEPMIKEYLLEYTGNHLQTTAPASIELKQLHGEIMVRVAYKKQSWMVKLEEIEKEVMLTGL